jgi:hypothetical protein
MITKTKSSGYAGFPRIANPSGEGEPVAPATKPAVLLIGLIEPGWHDIRIWTTSQWEAMSIDQRPKDAVFNEDLGCWWECRRKTFS